MIDDFPVRPILCDNNLSALPPDFQDHVVRRYRDTGVPLLDANSGFEPRTFDEEVFARWEPVNRGRGGSRWTTQGDLPHVERVLKMLESRVRSPKKKRVYVLIGNEPARECMERIQTVLKLGGEPHVQPLMKLNALEKRPWVRRGVGMDRTTPEGRSPVGEPADLAVRGLRRVRPARQKPARQARVGGEGRW